MTFKQKLAGIAGTVLLVAGAVFAQTPAPHAKGNHLQFLATYLDLTDAQKTAAQQIFSDAKAQSDPISAQLRQGHQDLAAAVKAGKSDAELTQLATTQGNLMGQLAAIHAKAFAKMYAQLTPAQQAKADQLHEIFAGAMMQHGFGGAMQHHAPATN